MGTTYKVVYFGKGPDPSSLVTASKLLSPSALEISAAVKFEEWSRVVRSNPSPTGLWLDYEERQEQYQARLYRHQDRLDQP
jgi:hypothetical protein